MPHLPSLAALSLDAHPTSVGYDDQSLDPYEMDRTREFNVLLIQEENDLNVFGVDPKSFLHLQRGAVLWNMRREFFEYMKNVIRNNLAFLPDDSVRFFKTNHAIGFSSSWNDAFNAGSTARALQGIWPLSSGAFNSTYNVDIESLPRVAKDLLSRVLPRATSHVVLRRSKAVYDTNEVLKELVMQARMSELELGPKLHIAWCIPFETRTTAANVQIEHVCSIIERFHGDLHDVFFVDNHPGRQWLNTDVQTGGHGFWSAVARCIVRGAQCGVVHFDLKGENMLYRRIDTATGDLNAYHYEVRYTDFDSKHFKILDIKNEVIKSRQFCLGILSLCQLLAVSRCSFRDTRFANEQNEVVVVDWASVFRIALDEFGNEWYRVHQTAFKLDFDDLCSFDEPLKLGGSPSLDGTKKVLDDTLRGWARHYLDTSRFDCVKIEENDPFAKIVRKVFLFVAGGPETGRAPAVQASDGSDDSDDSGDALVFGVDSRDSDARRGDSQRASGGDRASRGS